MNQLNHCTGKLSTWCGGSRWEIDTLKIPKHATDLYYSLLRILTIVNNNTKIEIKNPSHDNTMIHSSRKSKYMADNN